ncbi:PKD domain-containing protein, partial [Candidatus Gracilibacteria bacterium]|nr:PKD domain-containing protein [Candidatus Gracilibacteria bacterium]
MRKIILLLLTLFATLLSGIFIVEQTYSENSTPFTTLRAVDKGTFNEYRYRITKEFFVLQSTFEIDKVIDEGAANKILNYAKAGYNYLPDNLNNENNYNKLVIALKKGLKYPNNDVNYTAIRKAIKSYMLEADIQEVTGQIEGEPLVGNAPLVTTLRARVLDPSGSKATSSTYTWWMDVAGKRKVIGNKPSLSYTFSQEGNYIVFLDVRSSHRNSSGNIDVLPYSGQVSVNVQEKIASVIFRISGQKLPSNDEIKFSPEEASYGLIFDATSSVPTTGTKFLETSWDFGNGVTKSYTGSPRIERVIYSREGQYDATLRLKTNQLNTIVKTFKVMVHKPIASIGASQDEGYIGDKFVFKTVTHGSKKSLSYIWEVIDLEADTILVKKTGNVFNYSFEKKGRYSIKLKITDAAGNFDVDTKDIYINSRPPIANFKASIPMNNKPNKVYLDASGSFDPDFSDDGKLKYSWTIDGEQVNVEDANDSGSTGYYTFSTIGEHSVILEVEDLDGIKSIKKQSVSVNSTLSLDFETYPRVIQREGFIKFVANSPEAKFYEWDFGDGEKKSGSADIINHSYTRSGVFTVKLTVRGKDNKSNSHSKLVYVGDSKNPVAIIGLSKNAGFDFPKEANVCDGKEAYIISRKDNITFSSNESINTDGLTSGLETSWKIGQDKYSSSPSRSITFDELGCSPVKLTVKSIKDKTTDSQTIWVKVVNIKPTLSALSITPVDINSDPVVVNLLAVGAKDIDGVIQSYLWFYTTDADDEPQDFRVTKSPSTSFVLPKIPGSYYFGVVLKDNNEEKTTSEDVIGRNSITLVGDNVNTPIVELSVSDSSALIGDEIVFTATAENVLGKSIEGKSKFSWDFDGDGFYDKETDTGNISYKYKKSGTFYPKVKVKHKGFSNTRTLTVSVANKLVSDFSYISIGNKYVFLNQSQGVIDNVKWDLGDGTKKQNESKFVHTYDDRKSVHSVELTVAEGTKIKKSSQEVTRDLRNILKARKDGLNVFSHPGVDDDGIISIDEEESIFMYLGDSRGDHTYYGIDYDIDIDSDVNGGKDDDVDNLNNSSYKTGDPEEIVLNDKREQTIRLFLLDGDLNTIDSKDIKIIKTYIIKEEEIDLSTITFEGVSESSKIKIEKLKVMISALEGENRIKGMKYIQKLQENWEDDMEKTKTILEFEGFLAQSGIESTDDIIELLESLLIEGQGEGDEKEIAFQALKALTPASIECSVEEGTCSEALIKKLEIIKNSSDVELNKSTGKEILAIIALDKSMTNKEKIDFKAILQVLVYSGLDNIPVEVVEEVEKENPTERSTGEEGALMSFLKSIGWWAAGIVGVIIILMFIFWILDFLKNRKTGESFEDFVDEKTGDDVLGELGDDVVDPLATEVKKEEPIIAKPIEDGVVEKNEKIPDWLGKTEESNSVNPTEKIAEPQITEDIVIEESLNDQADTPVEEKIEIVADNDFDLEEDTKVSDDTPDWLQDSLVNNDEGKNTNTLSLDEEPTPEVENKQEEVNTSDNTPDWLQDSLTDKLPQKEEVIVEDDITIEEEVVEEEQIEELVDEKPLVIENSDEEAIDLEKDVPDWLKSDNEGNDEQLAEDHIANEAQANDVVSDKNKSDDKTSDDNIPDWLKGSLEEDAKKKAETEGKDSEKDFLEDSKAPISETNITEANDESIGKVQLDDNDVPDWLKGSMDEKSTNDEVTPPKGNDTKKGTQSAKKGTQNKQVKKTTPKKKVIDTKKDIPKTSEKKGA